jgi:hypothetical protein
MKYLSILFVLFSCLLLGCTLNKQATPTTQPVVSNLEKNAEEYAGQIKYFDKNMSEAEVTCFLGESSGIGDFLIVNESLTKIWKIKSYGDFTLFFSYEDNKKEYRLRMVVKDYGKETEEMITLGGQ